MNNIQHWDNIYATKSIDEVSWFQQYPQTAIDFVETFKLPLTANIIDIGGGDSYFVDAMLEKGYKNIWVLDISAKAIERAKKRLGDKGESVHWIVSDITDFVLPVQFDLWHDRATFHFLTSQENIDTYISLTGNGIKPNGHLILGTFSDNGPTKCSGLEIKQYAENSLPPIFAKQFEKIKCITENHITPSGAIQNFLFCSFKKK